MYECKQVKNVLMNRVSRQVNLHWHEANQIVQLIIKIGNCNNDMCIC